MAISGLIISNQYRKSNKWSSKLFKYTGSKVSCTKKHGYKLFENNNSKCAADITTYFIFEEIKDQWERHGGSNGDSIRGELNILLLNLFINYCNYPNSVLSTPRSHENAKQLGLDHNRFKRILDTLQEHRYIETVIGNNFENRTTRSRATPRLISKWLSDGWSPQKLKLQSKGGYLMTLKDANKERLPANTWKAGGSDVKRSMDYLKAFNKVYKTMKVRSGSHIFDMTPSQLYRVFNNSSWVTCGRFYGHKVQDLPSSARCCLLIENEPVVELDFKSLHLVMAYHNRGGAGLEVLEELELQGDLYAGVSHDGLVGSDKLPDPSIKLSNGKSALRFIKKKMILIAFNSSSDNSTINAAIDEYHEVPEIKELLPSSRKELFGLLKVLLSNIKKKHHYIADQLATGKGVRFQYFDSLVMERILRLFLLELNIPIIPIHDSIILQEKYERLGRAVLKIAHFNQWEGQIEVTRESTITSENHIEYGSSSNASDFNFRMSVLASIKNTLFGEELTQELKENTISKLTDIWDLDDWKKLIKSLAL
jgi:hypothetical protein